MRKVDVYFGDKQVGQLKELSAGSYEFTYAQCYLADADTPPISVNLPKRAEKYVSDKIFPFFTNMLPEGTNRRALCLANKVDEKDFFGMLEMICGMDCIGNVTLRKPHD